ncbi:TrbC/VirB2 family protein [Wolbachia endosymbiont of Ctenocephalides felis wCfeT]|uniref:TrbC/VirB2 family protein n=1 Tax=Wolbachia endosymbiont of Ctenocephalides felis wCfeT TaxID=2732593 RepID=UPI00144866A2|nr:TrbC/VirB2 family protein [Wolbachia endosymbiont of Ctenocephalides felis wCfeT]
MKNFLLLLVLIFSFAFDVAANNNSVNEPTTENTICQIVKYVQSLGGPMITVVIIGAALLAIFSRMPWPALFALGVFTAVFFGAPTIVKAISPNSASCDNGVFNGKANIGGGGSSSGGSNNAGGQILNPSSNS